MIDSFLQDLLDSPIDTAARANKVWLPRGKAPSRSSPEPEYHGEELPKLTAREVRERARLAVETKKAQLLAYYAKTDLTAQQVAEYVKLPLNDVQRRLRDLRAIQL